MKNYHQVNRQSLSINRRSLSTNRKILLILIVLAFALRFYKLGQIPLSLDWDEESNAYNGYSILKTARDEYGNFLPLYNRSFDDYKPPLYMYLEVPIVKLFGLTPLAARLPSAVFGTLTIPLMYLLVKRLTGKENIALAAMFLLAISPWHIQFSRVGFEANVGLAAALSASTVFIYGLNKWKLLPLAAVLFGLSAYSYHTERIFVPLLFLATALIYRREIFKIPKKYLSLFLIIGSLIILPLFIFAPQKAILGRLQTTTSGSMLDDIQKSIKLQDQDKKSLLPFANLVHNRRVIIAQTYLGNYLSHFDFNFLFIKGDDNFRHHIKGFGMLYLFELPLLIFGIVQLIKSPGKAKYFVFSWLLLAPIAAAPASPSPHAVRSFPELIPLEIISALGLFYLVSGRFKFKRLVVAAISVWIITAVFIYQENYWRHYPYDDASFWQYGYSDAVLQTQSLKDQYQKINIDHTLEQAYIFWLFTTKYDPGKYQANGSRANFDKYYFDAKPPNDSSELYVSDAKVFPDGFAVIKTIYLPDGTEDLKIGHPK